MTTIVNMSNINFFIGLKQNINDLINISNIIISNDKNINNIITTDEDEENIINEYSKIFKNIHFQVNDMKTLLDITTKYIQTKCQHEMEMDFIDINPDVSKSISYCKICELN